MHLMVATQRKFRRTADGMQTHDSFAVQVDALAPYFSRITLCVPVFDDPSFKGIKLEADNVEIHPLPDYSTRIGFLLSWPRIRRHLLQTAKNADVALVLMPGYFASCVSWMLQGRKLPVFHWIVSDWKGFARARRKDRGFFVRCWTALWTSPLDMITARLTGSTLNFVNGTPDGDEGHTFARISSTIRERDLYVPEPSTMTPPYRAIYIGRLADEKGIRYLLQALAGVEDTGASLDLVGSGEAEQALAQEAKQLALEPRVRFHGRLAYDAAQGMLREAHVLVLPSLMDQQPRVLMEAMLHGVPVIATDVGHVSSLVTHEVNGLLVQPGDARAIAEAMRRLSGDSSLRNTLITNGLQFVRDHTIEKETKSMVSTFDGYFTSLNRATLSSS